MSQATTRANPSGANTGQDPPLSKGLRGLLPYLRRYTWSIVIGLFMVVLMGIIGNVLRLAIVFWTDTLSGSRAPLGHSGRSRGAVDAMDRLRALSRHTLVD